MPSYQYKAARTNGEITEGHIEAESSTVAAQALQKQGYTPLSLTEDSAKVTPKPSWFNGSEARINNEDKTLFTLELSTLLGAKLPLAKALDTLQQLSSKVVLNELVATISQSVRRGDSLSKALSAHPTFFDKFYINMVRAGEASGALNLALENLARFNDERSKMRETLISALIYPSILLALALVAVTVMLTFVVPQFTEMFDQAGQSMPLLTRIVASSGDFLVSYWWLLLAAISGIIFFFRKRWKTIEGQEQRDLFLLKLPLLGNLIKHIETARFSRALGTLLSQGVSLVPALDIAKEIISNTQFSQALKHVSLRVRQGDALSVSLSSTQLFPTLAVQLIQVGEDASELNKMLLQVAEIFEARVNTHLKRLLALIEPMIIIFIALFISVIILSIVMLILASNDLAF